MGNKTHFVKHIKRHPTRIAASYFNKLIVALVSGGSSDGIVRFTK